MDFVTIALLLVAAVAQLAPFYWNLTVALKEQHSYRNRLQFFIAGAVGVLCLTIIGVRENVARSQTDNDYAYLVPAGAANNEAVFFFDATNNLNVVDVALRVTDGPYRRRDRFEHIREGVQADILYHVGIGDWTLDIDAPGEHGKMLQHLIIEEKDGLPTVTFSRVTRKGNHGLRMCQTPRTQLGIPPCFISLTHWSRARLTNGCASAKRIQKLYAR